MSTRCITPFHVSVTKSINGFMTNEKVPVPCGKCPPCKKRRSSGWSFRLVKEGESSYTSYFVTLTYNTDSVPITRNGFMSLRKKDLQDYFKRLRKRSSMKLKYYAVGEYGTKKMRPHYHVILFNAIPEDIISAWNLDNQELGNVHIGTVSEASIGYTLKYMCKENKIPLHKNDDRQPEWSIMSKGLGAKYLTPQMIRWHKNDLLNRMYVPLKDGKKCSMPRYYREKMYDEDEKKQVFEHIKEKADSDLQLLHEKHGENLSSYLLEIHKNQFRTMFKDSLLGRTNF